MTMTTAFFPLTLTQNDIYLDQLRHHRKPLYNVGGYINLHDIDPDKLREAHAHLVKGNTLFGLRIVHGHDGVFQTLGGEPAVTLADLDFSSALDPMVAADEWIKALFEVAIEIDDATLFRAYLLKLGVRSYRYVGLAHHIAMDGWGFSNWAKSLCALYNEQSTEVGAATSWNDIVADDARYVDGKQYINDKAHWATHLGDLPAPLYSVRKRGSFPESDHVAGRRGVIDIPRAELDALKSLAMDLRAGISHLILAMLATYFLHCHGHRKVVFGLPFHNRKTHAQKQMLGVFASISPLCVDMHDGNCNFGDLVRAIRKLQLSSLRHQRYPLGHMIRDLGGMSARRSLYDVGFNYLKLGGEWKFGDQAADLVYVSNNHSDTPLMVTLCEYGDHGAVQLQLDYNLSFISDADIGIMKDRMAFLLESLHSVKDIAIDDIATIPDREMHRLLQGFGDAPLAESTAACIHQLVERQAEKTPDAIAVEASDSSYTYRELNIRANRVAHRLMRAAVKPECLVGIYMGRTADMVVAILGVLKAGAAYVPLDCNYPWQRIQVLLEDSKPLCVLTQRHFAHVFAPLGVASLCVEECAADERSPCDNPTATEVVVSAANMAYVIYTSGSTGKPKGVQICHSNTVAFLDWVQTVYTPADLSSVLASTSINFDLSIFEIFSPLIHGGRCVVVKDALGLLGESVEVTLINTVPSAMKVLLEQAAIPTGVRIVNLAGEPLPMNVVNELLLQRKCEKVFNLYGPSEDTTYSTYAMFDTPISVPPSIGRAIAGTQLYVLSAEGRLLPMGAVGELHIAGKGLARGYLHAPELTAQKFIPHTFSTHEGERLYKTGDLVRYGTNCELEYLGRLDGQVKIRGFRVELGEIQRTLEQLDEVKTAVVLVQEEQSLGKHVVAYVERWKLATGDDSEIDDESWAEWLRHSLQAALPSYMVPSMIFVLADMPLTSNGKVDKEALQALEAHSVSYRQRVVAPRTPVEIKIASLWANILGVESKRIGTETSLFDLGGHSLLLVRFANEICHELDINLPVATLFQVTNLKELAQKVEIELTMKLIEKKISRVELLSEGQL